MTTRTRSKRIVSASYADRQQGRYQKTVPQWRIPSTYFVDRWLAYSMAYGPNAQFVQQGDQDSNKASQSWSSRVDRFSHSPSPYPKPVPNLNLNLNPKSDMKPNPKPNLNPNPNPNPRPNRSLNPYRNLNLQPNTYLNL